MRNPLAGKKAKLLYRKPEGPAVLRVEDEHDEILATVDPADGSMYLYRIAGLAGVCEAWEAASPFGAVLVPDDAGRKVWTRLEPELKPEPVVEPKPEPEAEAAPEAAPAPAPVVPAAVESTARTARTLAIQVRESGVKQKSDYLADGISAADAEACISHAVSQQWVVTDGRLLRPGPVSPYLPEPTSIGGSTRGDLLRQTAPSLIAELLHD